MKTRFGLAISFIFLFLLATAQDQYTKNQKVEVQWKGRWYKATVLEVKDNSYKIHYDGYASSWDETVPITRIRALGDERSDATKKKSTFKYGKYNCTASKYSNGAYEYIPKGSFEIHKNGTYSYNGFANPSTGTFTVDAKGIIHFKGGYLNKGQATPMEGEQNRYYLVFPTIPDGRWSCRFIE